MFAPFPSTASLKSSVPSAILLLFTLATLLNVTASQQVFAQLSTLAVTERSVLVAAAEGDDKIDKKASDDEDDDDAGQFRQPVRVGDLVGRAVIAPLESQDLLGHVIRLVRHGDDITIVMSYGGYFGFGTHAICVPADALALTGYALQAKDISTEDLNKLPPCDGSGDNPIDATASIKMKLAKPAH